MARLARVVVPGIAHHVTQRGKAGQKTFFVDNDYKTYLELLAEQAMRAGTQVLAYCLMPNHVHLILVPRDEDGLRRALAETHRRYARMIHARRSRGGQLWHERFHSFPVDSDWLLMAVRHIEQNPVRSRFVRRPRDWPWSSARAHIAKRDDGLVKPGPLTRRVRDWAKFLAEVLDGPELEKVRSHVRTGRPLGSREFVAGLEKQLRRTLAPQRRGRKPKKKVRVKAPARKARSSARAKPRRRR
jgi:putative transposase